VSPWGVVGHGPTFEYGCGSIVISKKKSDTKKFLERVTPFDAYPWDNPAIMTGRQKNEELVIREISAGKHDRGTDHDPAAGQAIHAQHWWGKITVTKEVDQ
jgi:hypothetical protein